LSGRILVGVVIFIVILIYVGYNIEPVGVRFLTWEVQVSKAVITLGAFLAGIVIGFILAKLDRFTRERKQRSLRKTGV
jgi:uncharacterized integral membrane protein